MSEKPEIQQIPIDPDGRCMLLVKGLPLDGAALIANQIEEWWQCGEPVLVVGLAPGVEVEFIRMDNDQKPSQG